MTGLHHPWQAFRALSDWRLKWAELPGGDWGETCFRSRTVTIAPGLTQAQRRCTIAHETQHILRGPALIHEALREELLVDRIAARNLMPSIWQVADEMVWASGRMDVAADGLWVDPYMLEVRLSALLPGERAYFEQRKADMLLTDP